jgi:3-oxoacyl-[acyl-carrier-protein] synthase-3
MSKVAERLGIPIERVYMNIERYGNTSAASIPVALDEVNRSGRLKPGDLLLLDAFGGGFTWGAVMIRW